MTTVTTSNWVSIACQQTKSAKSKFSMRYQELSTSTPRKRHERVNIRSLSIVGGHKSKETHVLAQQQACLCLPFSKGLKGIPESGPMTSTHVIAQQQLKTNLYKIL
eukprot:PhM_4_TR3075/c0_g3_i1/m.102430